MWRAILAFVVSIALGNDAVSAHDRHLRPLIEQNVVSVKISVRAAPTVPPVIVERAPEEASAIWRATGVSFGWRQEDSGVTAFTPPQVTRRRVIIDNSRGAPRDSGAPLGWVNFAGDEPDGRALAHEIGHYLLRSRGHATNGLMKGRRTVKEFIGSIAAASKSTRPIGRRQRDAFERSPRSRESYNRPPR
jgi:hypothetical protein